MTAPRVLRYTLPSQDGLLHITWGGGEYADVRFDGAAHPHCVINMTSPEWDGKYRDEWFSGTEFTQAAFEAACEVWLRQDADRAEVINFCVRTDA